MSTVLSVYLNKKVSVITTDGRLYIGVLEGYDHATNLALKNTIQLHITSDASESIEKGLFLIRGDCISTIGRVDPKLERRLDWNSLRGQCLKRIR